MPKQIKNYPILPLVDKFIQQSKNGTRLKKGGKKIRPATIEGYEALRNTIVRYSIAKNEEIRVRKITAQQKREYNFEIKYWKKFHHSFADFMYTDLDAFDNHVCSMLKILKTFFRYIKDEMQIDVLQFYRTNYSVSPQSIPVIVLQPEQLNFLIYNKQFEDSLPDNFKKIKDVFVFGCTVALRYSDLMAISKHHLEHYNNSYYLSINSNKTGAHTRMKLPEYAVNILLKYRSQKKKILPQYSNNYLNDQLKILIEKAGWVHLVPKTREKNGVAFKKYKNKTNKTEFRFCDHITCHTMRRTAITTMLLLGMNETLVRKISGHAPNSKEFYKYVAYSQKFFDAATDTVFDKLKESTFKA